MNFVLFDPEFWFWVQVDGYFYINDHLEKLIFDELRNSCRPGQVGGFLPAVKQIANVAALPGIVGRSVGLPDVHSGYGFAIGKMNHFFYYLFSNASPTNYQNNYNQIFWFFSGLHKLETSDHKTGVYILRPKSTNFPPPFPGSTNFPQRHVFASFRRNFLHIKREI